MYAEEVISGMRKASRGPVGFSAASEENLERNARIMIGTYIVE